MTDEDFGYSEKKSSSMNPRVVVYLVISLIAFLLLVLSKYADFSQGKPEVCDGKANHYPLVVKIKNLDTSDYMVDLLVSKELMDNDVFDYNDISFRDDFSDNEIADLKRLHCLSYDGWIPWFTYEHPTSQGAIFFGDCFGNDNREHAFYHVVPLMTTKSEDATFFEEHPFKIIVLDKDSGAVYISPELQLVNGYANNVIEYDCETNDVMISYSTDEPYR